jgi:hypothetical protein
VRLRSGGLSRLWKGTERARAFGGTVPVVFGPLAAPVAQQAHLEPVTDPPAIRREMDQDLQKQWAQADLEAHRRESRRIAEDSRPTSLQRELAPKRAPKVPAPAAKRALKRERTR